MDPAVFHALKMSIAEDTEERVQYEAAKSLITLGIPVLTYIKISYKYGYAVYALCIVSTASTASTVSTAINHSTVVLIQPVKSNTFYSNPSI